jgi:uncharacterized Fe-S cluster protein YjdI
MGKSEGGSKCDESAGSENFCLMGEKYLNFKSERVPFLFRPNSVEKSVIRKVIRSFPWKSCSVRGEH